MDLYQIDGIAVAREMHDTVLRLRAENELLKIRLAEKDSAIRSQSLTIADLQAAITVISYDGAVTIAQVY